MNPNRRPKTCLSVEQKAEIEKAWEEPRMGARLLLYELRWRGQHVTHNKIHQILRENGRSVPNPRSSTTCKAKGSDTYRTVTSRKGNPQTNGKFERL